MTKDILIIMTGGTIDAQPYADPARPPKNVQPLKDSLVPDAVATLGQDSECRFFQWMLKDSKDFTAAELHALAVFINARRADHIIVTHGTDRMAENSSELKKQMQGSNKTVIMTGSMLPLSNGRESDAYDNLLFAIEHIEALKPGVYVVMHTRLFEPGRFKKNFTTRKFEEVA
jgi:L-asparaginase